MFQVSLINSARFLKGCWSTKKALSAQKLCKIGPKPGDRAICKLVENLMTSVQMTPIQLKDILQQEALQRVYETPWVLGPPPILIRYKFEEET